MSNPRQLPKNSNSRRLIKTARSWTKLRADVTPIAIPDAYINHFTLCEVNIRITSPISLPNLQSLEVSNGLFKGWEHMCESLESLTKLDFFQVDLFTMPDLPNPAILKILNLDWCFESNELALLWLDRYSARFRDLQKFTMNVISPEAMKNILTKCPKIERFSTLASKDDPSVGDPTDEQLDIAMRHAPLSIGYLTLTGGRYSTESLNTFIASLPASILSLDLSDSEAGFTPSNLRALFQRPLQYLQLDDVGVPTEYVRELEEMAMARFSGSGVRLGSCDFYDSSEDL